MTDVRPNIMSELRALTDDRVREFPATTVLLCQTAANEIDRLRNRVADAEEREAQSRGLVNDLDKFLQERRLVFDYNKWIAQRMGGEAHGHK